MSKGQEPAPTGGEARVFGHYETLAVDLDSFVRMPQIREGLNPELKGLAADIEANGLLNPVDVTILNAEELSHYIRFVNRTWGSQVRLEDYDAQRRSDGTYILLIAGHTRIAAIELLRERDQTQRDYIVTGKIHHARTPAEIISIQLGENRHQKPSQERRAIAVVELLQFGREQQWWSTPGEFATAMAGRLGDDIIYEAIGFATLPTEARDLVFAGNLKYAVAVVLGRATEVIYQYAAARAGYQHALDPRIPLADIETAYRDELVLLIAHVSNERLNVQAAINYIKGQVNRMQDFVARVQASYGDGTPPLIPPALSPPEVQTRIYIRDLEHRLRLAVSEMAQRSIGSTLTAAAMYRALGRRTGAEEAELEHARRRLALGQLARLAIQE